MTFPEKLESRLAAFHPSWERLSRSHGDAYMELQLKGLPENDALDIATTSVFVARWRQHRAVYMLNDDLFRELSSSVHNMSDMDVLPAELLLNLPYPAIAVHLEHPFGVTADKNNAQSRWRTYSGDIMIYTVDDELYSIYSIKTRILR